MDQSENINELVSALAKAQGEIMPAIKDSLNPHFKSKYADLNSVWSACREPLSKNGLAIVQTMGKDESGQISLLTTLAHSSGQWIKSRMPIITNKMDPQGIGSALTYYRRYSLSAIVGISTDEDDDGEKAMGRNEDKKFKDNSPKKIGKDQWTELNQLIDQCDDEFQKKIWDYLNSQGIQSFAEMDEATYKKLKTGCIGNISSMQKASV